MRLIWGTLLGRVCALALLGSIAPVKASAEQGVLAVKVVDFPGRPVEGVEVSTGGDGSAGRTDRQGKTRIRLAPETLPGTWVTLFIKPPGGRDLVLLSPRTGKVLIPPFENESENYVELTVLKKSERRLLTDEEFLEELRARILSRVGTLTASGDAIPQAVRDGVVSDEATDLGLRPEKVEYALSNSSPEFPRGQGLKALFDGNFEQATQLLDEAGRKELEVHAQTMASLGRAQYGLGYYQEAAKSLRKALDGLPNDASVLNDLGVALLRVHDTSAAEDFLNRAYEIRSSILGPIHPDTIVTLTNLALFDTERGDYAKAERRLLEGITHLTGKTKNAGLRGVLINNLGELYYRLGRYSEAAEQFEEALKLVKEYNGEDHEEVATAKLNLAGTYLQLERTDECIELLNSAKGILSRRGLPNHPLALDIEFSIALYYVYKTGEYRKANETLQDLIDSVPTAPGAEARLPIYLAAQATVQAELGNCNDARRTITRAIKDCEARDDNGPSLVNALLNESNIYFMQRWYVKAEASLRKALILLEINPEEEPTTDDQAMLLGNLGALYTNVGRDSEAIKVFEKVFPVLERIHGKRHIQVARTLKNWGDALRHMGMLDDAEEKLTRARDIEQDQLPVDLGRTLASLGLLERERGHYDRAEELLQESARLVATGHGGDRNPEIAGVWGHLANVLEDQERWEEAEVFLVNAVEVQEKSGCDRASLARTLSGLGKVHGKMGNQQRAESYFRRALDEAERLGEEGRDVQNEVRKDHEVFLSINSKTK